MIELVQKNWEEVFVEYFQNEDLDDASHDLSHFQRVYKTALLFAEFESEPVDRLILQAAAYLHDVVSLPKNHPEANFSSRYAAIKACEILNRIGFPQEKIEPVCHAIEAHSFSAKITPMTLEAKMIQDADRMEALGALGIMRTFYVSGRMGRSPYDPQDLHALNRPLDDKQYGLDHFQVKLFKLPSLLQTQGGKKIAQDRTQFLLTFVKELESDLKNGLGGAHEIVWTCYEAGQKGLKLFEPTMELPLNPSEFALDQLKEKAPNSQFIQCFINQLHKEINI